MPVWAEEKQGVVSEQERTARIQELQRDRAKVESELRRLQSQPEGTARSTVPRCEFSDQPTRSMKESLESVPGVSARNKVQAGVTCNYPFVDRNEAHHDRTDIQHQETGWMVGIAISAVSLVPMALAEPDQSLRFGPKLTTDHPVRAVVGPSVQIDDEGRISLAWMEEDKDIRTVLYAGTEKSGGPIGTPVKVNQPTEAPYMRQESPALAVVGDDVFLTWALTHPKLTPDKPFSNELRLSRSTDGGKTFLPSILVNDDEQVIGHSFDSIHIAPDGAVHVAWIDGREGKKESGTFVTRSTDHGRTVAKNLKVDENTCVCCRTSLTTGPDGTLYVAWRKVLPGDLRETVVARSTDGGSTFSSPVIVGHDKWVFPGCPHRPASIGTDRLGRLYVVWYTEGCRRDPGRVPSLLGRPRRHLFTEAETERLQGNLP